MELSEKETNESKLSTIEISNLLTTKFVPPEIAEDVLEKPRAVAISTPFSPIERINDETVLIDHENRISSKTSQDEAVFLLNRIKTCSEHFLKDAEMWDKFDISKRWKNTRKTSEINLVNFVMNSVDRRPIHLHVYCHHLGHVDIISIIEKAIAVKPPKNKNSLFRITIKTKISLKQFLDDLEKAWPPTCDARNTMVTAVKNYDFVDPFRRYKTTDIIAYCDWEYKVHSAFMTSLARFTMVDPDKPTVLLNIEYHNELLNLNREKLYAPVTQDVSDLLEYLRSVKEKKDAPTGNKTFP